MVIWPEERDYSLNPSQHGYALLGPESLGKLQTTTADQ